MVVLVVTSFSVTLFDGGEAVVIVERGFVVFLWNCVVENVVVEDGVVKIDVDTDARDAEDALISSSTASMDTKIWKILKWRLNYSIRINHLFKINSDLIKSQNINQNIKTRS